VLVSQIVSENEPSLKMTARLGFEQVGVLHEVGRKFDRWLDLVFMEFIVRPAAEHSASAAACEPNA
jgi:phosphinothricin acetyltransferase